MCIERNIVSHPVWLAPAPAKYVSCWGPGSSLSPRQVENAYIVKVLWHSGVACDIR